MKDLISFLTVLCLFSCGEKVEYTKGHFQDEVVNFSEANSDKDDYNMDLPIVYKGFLLHFSSNRGATNHFDIVGDDLYVTWDKEEGTLDISSYSAENPSYTGALFDSVNTFCNELGPYSLKYLREKAGTSRWVDLLLYANDCNGNYDIKLVYTDPEDENGSPASQSQSVRFLQTGANELYPSFYGAGFGHSSEDYNLQNIGSLLYCSDSEGNFNIYETSFAVTGDFIDYLQTDVKVAPLKISINSTANDKCPYVHDQVLVFASDRPGGFGGFDLYYSLRENGSWTEPVNFGEKINSEYDEYRPVVLTIPNEFTNDLMLFSSNRPGGKGGFDLYHVGIDPLNKD